MRKILITGFEPFGGQATNSSWEVVKRLPSAIGDFQVFILKVPVVFGLALKTVADETNNINPDFILCLGQASGRSVITPEYVAINLRNASRPDNHGYEPHDIPVVEGGPDAYFTTLPVRKMVKAMSDAGIPSEISYSAGTYVCNDLMYGLLHQYNGTGTKIGFIHIPELSETDINRKDADNTAALINIDDAVRAVEIAVECC